MTKAFKGFGPSFRKDGCALLEDVYGFHVAEHDNLSTIDHRAVSASSQFRAKAVPPQDAFHITGLTADNTTFGCGL